MSHNISSVTHQQGTFDMCDGSPKAFQSSNMGASPGNQGEFMKNNTYVIYRYTIIIGVNAGCEDTTCPIPKEDSDVVLSEKEALLCRLDRQTFVKNLDRVGSFIYIGYTCFIAAGPKFHSFQIEMKKLGFNTENLLNDSSIAVNEFISTSHKMLTHLEDAYGYLVEDNVDLSIKRLQRLEDLAQKSSLSAKTLSLHFEKHNQQVSTILEKTLEENDQPTHQRKYLLQKEGQKVKKKKTESYYQQKERALEKKLQEIRIVSRYDILLSTFFSQEHILDLENDVKLSQTHQEKDIASDLSLDDFISKLEHGRELDLVSFSILSLHYASCALNDLRIVMLNLAHYWYSVQIYCEKHLSESYIREDIEASCEPTPGKQLWKSRTFRKSFMKFCARFVALQSVSTEFLDKIKLVQKDFCKNQRIILTYEDARQILILHCRKVEDILNNLL